MKRKIFKLAALGLMMMLGLTSISGCSLFATVETTENNNDDNNNNNNRQYSEEELWEIFTSAYRKTINYTDDMHMNMHMMAQGENNTAVWADSEFIFYANGNRKMIVKHDEELLKTVYYNKDSNKYYLDKDGVKSIDDNSALAYSTKQNLMDSFLFVPIDQTVTLAQFKETFEQIDIYEVDSIKLSQVGSEFKLVITLLSDEGEEMPITVNYGEDMITYIEQGKMDYEKGLQPYHLAFYKGLGQNAEYPKSFAAYK